MVPSGKIAVVVLNARSSVPRSVSLILSACDRRGIKTRAVTIAARVSRPLCAFIVGPLFYWTEPGLIGWIGRRSFRRVRSGRPQWRSPSRFYFILAGGQSGFPVVHDLAR